MPQMSHLHCSARRKSCSQHASCDPPRIAIHVSRTEVKVADRCGGIPLARAKSSVFRLGRVDSDVESALGVYGIGLKRAIFKIGREIVIESRTRKDGFRLALDVDKWTQKEGWSIPFEQIAKASSAASAGTTITIRRLTPEVTLRLNDPTLLKRLADQIATTYTLFLSRVLGISLNGKVIASKPLPIGSSDDIAPAYRELTLGNVNVELVAGLAARKDGEWNVDRAGWYVLCNGRVVVAADKTELTGWGIIGPQFASKYRGFVGIAFFFSEDPASLPWTTTKRGLNQESEAFQRARKEMATLSRPVLSFLNSMYPSEPAEDVHERTLADQLKPVDVRTVASTTGGGDFRAKVVRREKTKVQVQFSALSADVDKVRRRINRPTWGAGAVGRHAFQYFLKMECSE
jgi:hypothetical protein